jgi:hypothetical protein
MGILYIFSYLLLVLFVINIVIKKGVEAITRAAVLIWLERIIPFCCESSLCKLTDHSVICKRNLFTMPNNIHLWIVHAVESDRNFLIVDYHAYCLDCN